MKYFVSTALLSALSMPVIAANDHYQSGDLISVHWDSSYDYDDLQAMPATREIFDDYSNLNYIVINGTKSHRNTGIVNGSSDVMRMVFPEGLDAFHDKNNSLYAAADRWQATLQSGGTVHIAEGGPSDFTADIVRELQSRNVSNLKNIHTVQHSQWNESHTSNANLSLIKNTTTYQKIEDGNRTNSTAWLRTDRNKASLFQNLTSSSHYSHVWNAAFQAVTNPDRVVDFSDAVEVLEILNVSTDDVSNAVEFGAAYFGGDSAVQPESAAPALPAEPSVPTTPTAPTTVPSDNDIAVYGSSLSDARARYSRATSLRRVDCDPANGGYICASFANPSIADLQSPLQPTEPTEPAELAVPSVPVVSSGRVAVFGSNLSAARRAYASATNLRRIDCDPANGGYICASFRNPVLSDIDAASSPSQPTDLTDPSAPEIGNNLRFEVENYSLGAGWVRDTSRSGYSGSGYIRWTGGNQYNISQAGKGIMAMSLKPDSSGVYSLRLRSRAISPAASHLNNDVWVRLNGSAWTKIFNAGKDQWIIGGKADVNHRRYVFQQNLSKGRAYTLEISGRSNGFAIDYIELVKN